MRTESKTRCAFNEIKAQKKIVAAQKARLENLRAASTSIGAGGDGVRVQGGKTVSRTEITVENIAELERDIKEETKRLEMMKAKAKRKIDLLKNPMERAVLKMHYVDCATLEQTADALCYSADNIKRIARRAFKKLDAAGENNNIKSL